MPNPDFFTLPRAEQTVKTKTFTDAKFPDRPVTISLHRLDTLESYEAYDLRQEMVAKYLAGDETYVATEGEKGQAPVDFPPVGKKPVKMSASLCEMCANYAVMQADVTDAGLPNTDKLSFEQLVAMSATMPDAWNQLQTFAVLLGKDEKKSGSGDGGEPPPASESAGTTDTPNLISEPMPS